ncbi:MAG: hypothetical protein AAF936_05605 [Pseudomonadota bacterium]
MSERIRKANRRYKVEMIVSMLLYMGVLVAAKLAVRNVEGDIMRAILALAPVAPLALAGIAFFRFYLSMDERDKRISADAAALSLLIGILTALTLGLLRAFEVFSLKDEMMWFGPYLIILWGVIRFLLGGREC